MGEYHKWSNADQLGLVFVIYRYILMAKIYLSVICYRPLYAVGYLISTKMFH